MPVHSAFVSGLLALALASGPLCAQGPKVQPTPFSVWLNLEELGKPGAPKPALPIWIEDITRKSVADVASATSKTVFRVRLRHVGSLSSMLQLRLFFFDRAGGTPTVTGWTETGLKTFSAGALGAGLDLPSSASVTVPAAEIDYLEIELPGDGADLRGAFLSPLQKHETRRAVDFSSSTDLEDPFGNLPETVPSADDEFLYGRVRATIDAGVLKLTAAEHFRAEYGFELQEQPSLALCTFELLNADPLNPPRVWVNGKAAGRASLHVPDLADPAFQSEPSTQATHYAGWLRAQVVIRGTLLEAGLNKVVLGLDERSEPVAIRAVQLQLKQLTKSTAP